MWFPTSATDPPVRLGLTLRLTGKWSNICMKTIMSLHTVDKNTTEQPWCQFLLNTDKAPYKPFMIMS